MDDATRTDFSDRISKTIDDGRILQRYKNVLGSMRTKPREPVENPMPLHYQIIGSKFNVDPAEAEILIRIALKNINELTQDAIRQLLLLGRMYADTEISELRNRRAEVQARYEEELARWEENQKFLEDYKEQYQEINKRRDSYLKDGWISIIDSLEAQCEKHGYAVRLLDDDAQKLTEILIAKSRFFMWNAGGLTFAGNWNEARKFHTDHVAAILVDYIQ